MYIYVILSYIKVFIIPAINDNTIHINKINRFWLAKIKFL